MKLRLAKLFWRSAKRELKLLSCLMQSQTVKALLPEKTEFRELPPFSRISVSSMVDLEFTQAVEQRVALTVAHNVTSMISLLVVGGELQISVDCDFISSRRPRVVCSAPSIDSLRRSGSGSLICHDLSCDALAVEHFGTGQLLLIGKVGNLFVTMKGAGHVDCSNLENDNLKLSLVGDGVFEGPVQHVIDCYLQGNGHISITNQPKVVNAERRGAGSIRINGMPAG